MDRIEPTQVVICFGQQANPALEMDRAHPFDLAPERRAPFGRVGRNFVVK